MSFVLVRNEDGKYVAPPGQKHSYTGDIRRAQQFRTRAEAEANACGNETARRIEQELRG